MRYELTEAQWRRIEHLLPERLGTVGRPAEDTLSRALVESGILLAASRGNPTTVLKDAATTYKVHTDAITAKVKQEFAAKDKAKKAPQPAKKATKKAAA